MSRSSRIVAGAAAAIFVSVVVLTGEGVAQHVAAGTAAASLSGGPVTTVPTKAPTTAPAKAPASLGSALQGLPDGADVFAAIVHPAGGDVTYESYEAGGGAHDDSFWPASSIKTLAVAGALEFLGGMGFDGGATVSFDDGEAWAVKDLYDAAIVDSSNDAYDRLVQIAGVDWLNSQFLTPARGFADTVIQRSYVDGGALDSPPMAISENDHSVDLPERDEQGDYGVPDAGNRSDLAEMTDAVSRIVLADEVAPAKRFKIGLGDAANVRQDLLETDGFVEPGVTAALGSAALTYSKPGYVPGDDCVDVAVVRDSAFPGGALLGVAVPDDGQECATLAPIATAAMNFLQSQD